MAQVTLAYGCNDFGGTMIEENVVSQAGATFMLTAAEIERHIQQAGFVPRRRQMDYTLLAHQPAAAAP